MAAARSTARPFLSPTRLQALVFALGLAVSGVLLLRSIAAGDQLNLLSRGWLLAREGRLVAFGNPGSSGGAAPGALTSVLVGLPLTVWSDFRAPILPILLLQVLAYALLDRLLREAVAPRDRLVFAVLYWLSPARLYLSGLLWNPGYLCLFSALHLWTAFRQREKRSFGLSFLHVLALGLAAQLHASAVILGLASLALLWRRYWRIHWGGAIAGGVASLALLVPWFLALARQPEMLPAGKGFPLRGLLLVFPTLRGVFYWLRDPTLAVAEKISRLDFTEAFGPQVDRLLAPAGKLLLQGIAPLSLIPMLLASLWLLRRARRAHRFRPWQPIQGSRAWLAGYALWCFAATVAASALSPTTVMWWQVVIVLHAALLAPLLWLSALLRSRRASLARRGLVLYAGLALAVALALGFGAPQYRCTGRAAITFPLVSDHPMLHQLGIQNRCPYPLNVPGGWWPDVLPQGGPAPR
ncbi:MAG: hypothetical protein U0002_20035 [Thermoanaerobaculia bacterium]